MFAKRERLTLPYADIRHHRWLSEKTVAQGNLPFKRPTTMGILCKNTTTTRRTNSQYYTP